MERREHAGQTHLYLGGTEESHGRTCKAAMAINSGGCELPAICLDFLCFLVYYSLRRQINHHLNSTRSCAHIDFPQETVLHVQSQQACRNDPVECVVAVQLS